MYRHSESQLSSSGSDFIVQGILILVNRPKTHFQNSGHLFIITQSKRGLSLSEMNVRIMVIDQVVWSRGKLRNGC